ncbi:DUF302 domain-containing protein [Blastococcus sp. MG754426]|uniref:DUF302 domain-containing protein n=1 Tax=unclassified Blastococcus TaxID=2619396 RepID=UPI001EF1076C|nr:MULTISPECIES: DUF302 domain-containing protein [unclassified Blastococcus]MCF6509663.1 DUF302 domain-containing protein [Blastococcus sp. MG754426]MCF6510726.1 DUF302 domain-containing protein [Blastococcus sp. MG754427]
MSGYGIATTLDLPFAEAVARTREALAGQGFGILTEIDVAATMRVKLGVEIPPQVSLGACNPPLAYRGLAADPDLGLLLPCNVVVRALDPGRAQVSAIDPGVLVETTGNAELAAVADEARSRLRAAVQALPTQLGVAGP